MLHHVQASSDFDSKSTNDADALLQKWLRFDTMMAASLLLQVYSILRHASDCLQTKGLDCLSAWKMVEKAKARLCDIQFNEINDRVHNFISTMKEELDDIDAELQAEFEKCRVTKRKSMPVQEEQDEIPDDVVQSFHVEDFRHVIDQITTGITERFLRIQS